MIVCQIQAASKQDLAAGIVSYDLKKFLKQYKKGSTRDFSLLRETPFGNSLTTDFALKLIENERLGTG